MIIKFYTGFDARTKALLWSAGTAIPDMSDATVEAARRDYEKFWGKPLPLNERTDFPHFQIQDDNGEWIAGG